VFVDREWLADAFAAGKSLEQIGRETQRHPSTVGYWAKKHGLVPPASARFARRGAPDRRRLGALAEEGLPLRQIAGELDRSIATVRHWLRVWKIERRDARLRTMPDAAPDELIRDCHRHSPAVHRLDRRGTYRCARCAADAVSERRRKVKRILVAEAGGACVVCGYRRCIAALQFHHVDRASKQFALSNQGMTRSLEAARRQARKCVLLCANCHAEIEAGYRTLEAA
jgi:Homeodomain-like domain